MLNLDSALEERVLSAIAGNPHLAGRNLRFETELGCVRLHGVVGSYFQKQMAQEALRHVPGVAAIENELEVSWLDAPSHRSATILA